MRIAEPGWQLLARLGRGGPCRAGRPPIVDLRSAVGRGVERCGDSEAQLQCAHGSTAKGVRCDDSNVSHRVTGPSMCETLHATPAPTHPPHPSTQKRDTATNGTCTCTPASSSFQSCGATLYRTPHPQSSQTPRRKRHRHYYVHLHFRLILHPVLRRSLPPRRRRAGARRGVRLPLCALRLRRLLLRDPVLPGPGYGGFVGPDRREQVHNQLMGLCCLAPRHLQRAARGWGCSPAILPMQTPSACSVPLPSGVPWLLAMIMAPSVTSSTPTSSQPSPEAKFATPAPPACVQPSCQPTPPHPLPLSLNRKNTTSSMHASCISFTEVSRFQMQIHPPTASCNLAGPGISAAPAAR